MPKADLATGDRWAHFLRRLRSRRVVVYDDSMRPALLPGDRLLVDPAAFRDRAPRPGEIVVSRDPERSERWLVKRIGPVPDAGPPDAVYLVGDVPEASRDSRAFGPVPISLVVGEVWYRYLPADRRGPIPASPLSDVS